MHTEHELCISKICLDTDAQVVGRPGKDVVHISGRPLLSNDAVNFISANLTACVGALIVLYGKANYPYER